MKDAQEGGCLGLPGDPRNDSKCLKKAGASENGVDDANALEKAAEDKE